MIDAKGGNGSLSWVHLSNRKDGIVLMINKTIYKSGFAQNYSFNIGDSLIKKAGSNKFTIKRNKNIAIYQIDCDGYR